MNKKLFIWIGGVIVVVILLVIWRGEPVTSVHSAASWNQSKLLSNLEPAPAAEAPARTESTPLDKVIETEREREGKIWDAGLATPIRFYGKVIDEQGNPIEGATAHISLSDHMWEGNTKMDKLTDPNGMFSVSGRGLGISVMISKAGYYHLAQSDGVFGYAKGAGTGSPHPNSNDPAIFLLRKVGKTDPLIVVKHNYSIAKNGAPVEVSLTTGKVVRTGRGDIKVEAWTSDQEHEVNSNQSFDWRCRISVPGGGLARRVGEFDFEAPISGYVPADEIEMPATLGQQWRTQASRNYFINLANGTYARLEFRMIAGGDHFFRMTSYLNLQAGSRNLEFGEQQPGTAP